MPHVEPDRLVLLALGEDSRDALVTDHLLDCEVCRRELDDLRTVAGVARRTQDTHDLPAPPPQVWSAIAQATARTREETGGRRAPGWRTTVLVALAAAMIAAGATIIALWTVRPGPTACTQGVVSLTPLPAAPPGAGGTACLVTADGEHKVRVHTTGMPAPTNGNYEVWLLDPSTLHNPKGPKMKSLGNLDAASTEDFTVPANTDLTRYTTVDISAEPDDGDSTHSPESLLRAVLPPT